MKRHVLNLIMFQIVLIGAGCQSSDPTVVEEDFGNSVRQMVQAQIYDLDAALDPNPEPPMTMDGVKASNSLESYHKDIGNPDSNAQPVRIDIDAGN